MNPAKWIFYIQLFLLILIGHHLSLRASLAIETSNLTATVQIIKDGEFLESNNKNFALGFFSLTNSSTTRRYLGIRYNDIPDRTLVWVANRNKPLSDNSGTFAIDSHGNIVIYTITQNISLWSTNVSIPSTNDVSVQLLNTGNLVVIHTQSQEILWQSFDYPSNTLLPYNKLGFDRRTGFSWFLTSWKAPDDPGEGNFTLRIDPSGFPQLVLYENNLSLWRAGTWTGRGYSGVPEMAAPPPFIINVTYVDDADEVYFTNGIEVDNVLVRLSMDETGFLRRTWRREKDRKWIEFWSGPTEWCDNYNRCGPNSNCDQYNTGQPQCGCLPGFEPESPGDWLLRDTSGGCVRKRGNATCRSGEGFWKVERVKAPDTSEARVEKSMNLEECKQACLEDCNCTAYTNSDETTGMGCIRWYGDLVDTRAYAVVGQDLYVRVDAVELAQYSENSNHHSGRKSLVAIVVVPIVATLLLVTSLVYLLHKRKKRREKQSLSNYFGDSPNPSALLGDLNPRTSDHLPVVFDFTTIEKATDHFSFQNKLGQGGFGSVYKGRLKSGEEIAVKRLAKNSGQGVGEFKNEVTLIAKLQHRNLVRILGFCIQHEEKMLVYEYLPNRSLDSFIFDELKRALLGWTKRFEIIIGIARGILYLHQDSRLKIIHRDLKASNVLLDGDLNPKIADFGLAKIFSNDQIEANTNRIVGTYGYMSPEYAMEGLFSEKSDVYSFGVLLLEIIAGRKNNSYKDASNCTNLVGQVWELWKLEKAMEVVDSTLDEPKSSFGNAIMKCIQIGLLCVEDDPADRPTMSTVVFMLSNEVVLPAPKKPAFILRRSNYNRGDQSTATTEGASKVNSVNDATLSILEAR